MTNYQHYYLKADNLLREIANKEQGRLLLKEVAKFYSKDQAVEILLGNEFIALQMVEGEEVLLLCPKGKEHLDVGGFKSLLFIADPEIVYPTFRQHLESHINLLTIFGILNAVLIFASQAKDVVLEKLDLLNDGMQFVNLAMYALSILVLVEIIKSTLEVAGRSWQFHAYYFCLCFTTLGIGLMFIVKYHPLMLGILFFLAYLGCTYLLGLGFITIIVRLPGRMLRPIKGKTKLFSGLLWLLSMLIMAALLKLILRFI